MKRAVFFDLDGTLTDPSAGVLASVRYALGSLGEKIPEEAVLRSFIGPPLADSFVRVLGMTPQRANEAIRLYRVYYGQGGMFENRVYPGVPQLLGVLKRQGRLIVLATSKPEEFARDILAHFDLLHAFDFLGCATMDDRRRHKADVIAYALSSLALSPQDCVMVGDRCFDVAGARENGMGCIGVSYGFGSMEELRDAGALALADTPQAVAEALQKLGY